VTYRQLRSLSHDQALAARADLVAEARNLADTASRDNVDHVEKRTAEIQREIRDVDEHIAEFGGSRKLGARAAATNHGDGETRTLGEWASQEFRSLAEGTGGGQYLVPAQFLGRVWDRLAAKAVGLAAGFSVIDTDRDELHVPRVTSDATAGFYDEGDEITPSDPGLNEVVATPKKLAALVQASNEVIADSNPAVLDVVFSNLTRAMTNALDLAFFEGAGGTNPATIKGLKNVVGIQSLELGTGDGDALADLDPFADAIGMLEQENAEATAFVMHPRTWKQLLKLRELATGSNKPLLSESAGSPTGGISRTLYGIPVFLTSQLSITETVGTATDCSSVYAMQASEVVAVRRAEARIEVDRSRLFNFDQSEIRAVTRWDLVVPNTKAVVRISGITG
jgi:HK97 family phage major capsid protein